MKQNQQRLVFLGAAVGGAVVSMIFGLLTQYLLTNQVATGLALTLFGVGLSALVGQGYQATNQVPVTKMPIPLLSDIPVVGPILFRHDGVVYLSLVIVAAVFVFLSRSRAGMILRAVGENHDAAHALGYNVRRVRLMAIAFGGACAGLGALTFRWRVSRSGSIILRQVQDGLRLPLWFLQVGNHGAC